MDFIANGATYAPRKLKKYKPSHRSGQRVALTSGGTGTVVGYSFHKWYFDYFVQLDEPDPDYVDDLGVNYTVIRCGHGAIRPLTDLENLVDQTDDLTDDLDHQ